MQQISVADKTTGISNGSSIIFELMEKIFQNTESLAHRLYQHECKNKISAPFLTHRQCFCLGKHICFLSKLSAQIPPHLSHYLQISTSRLECLIYDFYQDY